MNAQRNTAHPPHEATLRERAAAARANAVRLPKATLEERFSGARAYADHFDFSPFSLTQVARLYEISRQMSEYLGHMNNMPVCTQSCEPVGQELSAIGWFLNHEEERSAFLRDRCIQELTERQPSDDRERDQILEARIAHEINCNTRIAEPGLLIEALKAWG